MTLFEAHQFLVSSGEFKGRLALAIAEKVRTISGESETGLEVSARKRMAAAFLQDSAVVVDKLVEVIATDSSILAVTPITSHADVSDTLIRGALTDPVWDGVAAAF